MNIKSETFKPADSVYKHLHPKRKNVISLPSKANTAFAILRFAIHLIFNRSIMQVSATQNKGVAVL